MLNLLLWLHLFLSGQSQDIVSNKTAEEDRRQKALSIFTVVKFPNTGCQSSTSGRNGTCYTVSECAANGGSSSGACASSFGVCCVFEKSCGGSSSENLTYFTASDRTLGGSCSLTVCKSQSDVCQLRLDFETFVLSDPVTVTTLIGLAAVGAGAFNNLGACVTDSFSVSSPGAKAPPLICGTNTGYHMYIPASDQCNVLTSNFGSSSTATTSAFTIKVTQVECSSKTLAPNGCTQYITGTTGTLETYNYNSAGGQLLQNQDYAVCVRAERAVCTICYSSTAFKMNVYNGISANGAKGFDTNCGYFGVDGTATSGGGYDYIEIANGQCDSPVAPATIETTDTADRYCGTSFLCVKVGPDTANPTAATKNTVCTSTRPFKLHVHSDSVEFGNPAADGEGTLANNRGFSIAYWQKSACLTVKSS